MISNVISFLAAGYQKSGLSDSSRVFLEDRVELLLPSQADECIIPWLKVIGLPIVGNATRIDYVHDVVLPGRDVSRYPFGWNTANLEIEQHQPVAQYPCMRYWPTCGLIKAETHVDLITCCGQRRVIDNQGFFGEIDGS